MDYGNVLSRAWKIIWQHKVLWIFGILAGLGNTGSSGGSAANGSNISYQTNEVPRYMEDFAYRVQDFFNQIQQGELIGLLCLFLLVVLVISAILIFLSTVGKIGLIQGVWKVEQGATRLTFGELFRASTPYFWRVFGMYFLVVLIFALVIIVLAVPLAFTIIGLICLICLAIPAAWLLMAVLELAANAIVVENLGITAGLKRSWQLVRTKFGPVLVIWLLLLVIGLVAGFILALPFILLMLPLIFSGAFLGSDFMTSGWVIFLVCLCAYLPFLLILNGILQSYVGSVWTLTYLRLTGQPKSDATPTEFAIEAPTEIM
ncbi:MAG: putative rane protein [Chloroflexi bacterium]|nr:putative rane protein [Chloroflexota bacterium]